MGGSKIRTPAGAPAEDGRNETREEQLDRNWGEILQELRVMQTGTQLIAGFLLTLPFQQRFAGLDSFQIASYLALVLLAAGSTALMLVPVALHRRLFRHRIKEKLVADGDLIVKTALAFVGLLVAGTTAFVAQVVAGRFAGMMAGGCIVIVLIVGLVIFPLAAGQRHLR